MIESEIVKISKNVVNKVSFLIILYYAYYGSYFFVSVFIFMLEWLWLEGGGFFFDAGWYFSVEG